MSDRTQVAIVGFGPRGLGALESLAAALSQTRHPLNVDIFEPSETPGAGPNFDPDESPLCRLNIPVRDIDIRPPKESGVGAFADWLGDKGNDPDFFPPRADLGRYLTDRYRELVTDPALNANLVRQRIDAIEHDGTGWHLRSGDTWFGPYREVLLTLGQPSVDPDDQLAEWQAHQQASDGVLANAYPARDLAQRAQDWAGRTLAIRGLALSAFDVLRVLTVGQGGAFRDGRYLPSGREASRIIPFSLDGRPPFPKPATEGIDALYQPTKAETDAFLDAMGRAATADASSARQLITGALIPVADRVLSDTGGSGDAGAWLDQEWSSPGSQEDADTTTALRDGIAMAEGRRPPSVGYVIGQIWRKWQDQVRQGYNPAETPAETAETLIGFDEGLKRYSYGPPVSSSRELLALIEAGIVDPAFAADPDITLSQDGWTLSKGDRAETAQVMVDAVLPTPDLSIVTAPLITDLLDQGRLCQGVDGFGAHIAADGTVLRRDGTASEGLCFLGRLALGSVIAVDSLHDCFGQAAHRWAKGAIDRLG